jgi:hypothetical protein
MKNAVARVAGSEQITSSVACVSALIGLWQTLHQSQPDLVPDAIEHRRLHAGLDEHLREPLHVGRGLAGGLAERKTVT